MRRTLTEEERAYFDEKGFLILENTLSQIEVADLVVVVDELYRQIGGEAETGRMEVRNCVARHPRLLQLIDHPMVLPVVAGLLGPNIKIRSSHLDVRPPLPRDSVTDPLGRNRPGQPEQWHVDGPLYGYPSVRGILPMIEVKVGFYLTDLTNSDSGTLCVVPGSHKLDYRLLADDSLRIRDDYVFRMQVPAGAVVVFRTGLWHCAGPNLSDRTRKVLYYDYTFRWVEPNDYISQPEELLSMCTPIQRQLLGATTSPGRHPLGSEPELRPRSFYWFTEPEDLPVKTMLDGLGPGQGSNSADDTNV